MEKNEKNDPSHFLCKNKKAGRILLQLLTHGSQLGDELVFAPFLALGPERDAGHHQELGVVRVGNVEIVDQHNVGILSKRKTNKDKNSLLPRDN